MMIILLMHKEKLLNYEGGRNPRVAPHNSSVS